MKNRVYIAKIGFAIATVGWFALAWDNFSKGDIGLAGQYAVLTVLSIISSVAVYLKHKKITFLLCSKVQCY